jgi:glycosyltransferase involved in cell wall biosynthesis
VPGDSVTLVNLSRVKGADVFWRLARRFPDTPFLGVRGGYGEQLLERRPNVTVLGPQRDMRDVYARTRVLLMPSRAETWGMVAVEAMASGIPVLARPTAGLRESLGRAGNYPTDDSLDAWQDALARLLSQRGWAGAAARARRRSRELDPAAERRTFADALEDVAAGRAL